MPSLPPLAEVYDGGYCLEHDQDVVLIDGRWLCVECEYAFMRALDTLAA